MMKEPGVEKAKDLFHTSFEDRIKAQQSPPESREVL